MHKSFSLLNYYQITYLSCFKNITNIESKSKYSGKTNPQVSEQFVMH